MATNRHSDNLAIWSHITSSLLASWINDKNIPNEVNIRIENLFRLKKKKKRQPYLKFLFLLPKATNYR